MSSPKVSPSAEPLEQSRVAFVAGDGCPAGAVGCRYDAAADAAIRACRMNARRLCAGIQVLRPEVLHESLGRGRVHLGVFRADLDERNVDIWCHAGGVAADIEMGALAEPRPKIGTILAHLVLHIDFLFRIARPGEGELGERARGLEP